MSRAALRRATAAVLILGCLAQSAAPAFAQAPPPAPPPVGEDIVYKTQFRADQGWWNMDSRAARAILDEMAANGGNDNVLDAFEWSKLQDQATFAAHWIRVGDQAAFGDTIRAIEESQSKLEERATEIEQLRNRIDAELTTEKARWTQLMAGDEVKEHLLKSLAIDRGGDLAAKLLEWLGGRLRGEIASKLATGAGKVIGPISTLVSLGELFSEYSDLAEMEVMMDRLLERVEMIAFLDVLAKKYDVIIDAQDQVIQQLYDAFNARQSAKCD